EVSWKCIGFTSNLFFFDELYYGVIISTKGMTNLIVNERCVTVECGYSLQDLVRVALVNGLGGLEGLEGVPGTVGGALFMNAGAYGFTISDCLAAVTVITPEGNICKLSKEDCGFKNRSSIFREQEGYIILSAEDRKSTRLNSSHVKISYAVFCLKK